MVNRASVSEERGKGGDFMPVKRFKSKSGYLKWQAYKHMHGLLTKHDLNCVIIAGHKHKVHHVFGEAANVKHFSDA
jgi:hypothetical protein